jgi:DNA replication protein DnaC
MENYLKLNQQEKAKLLDESLWEALGLDPKKGLLIMGPVGVGKTTLMKEFLEEKNKGPWITDYEVKRGVQQEGYNWFNRFVMDHLTFDDLGAEPETILSYGHQFNPGEEIIQLRYEVFQRTAGRNRTCFTTNYNREDLLARYGERCYSRLQEMCNFIVLEGPDLRIEEICDQRLTSPISNPQ